jgi:hypothetical protein
MKCLCMIFFFYKKKLDALPKPEYDALVNASRDYVDVLRKVGQLLIPPGGDASAG